MMLNSTPVSELNENQGCNTNWAKRTTRAGHDEHLLLYFVFKLEPFLFVCLIYRDSAHTNRDTDL